MPSLDQSRQSSQSQTAMVPGMHQVYGQLLKLNTRNYNNVLKAYGQGQQTLASNLGGIYAGYSGLQNQVMHTLGVDGGGWGVATPAAQQIAQGFARQQGQTQQDAINRGLGNTTVLQGLSQQNQLNAAQAYGGLGAQLAQTAAGYQSQLGMAGLGARMQGLGMQNSLAESYMGDLSRYEFRNTAGNLTGSFGSSQGSSQGQSTQAPMMGGGGSNGMGHIGEPNFGGGGGLYDYGGSISPIDYSHGVPSYLSGGGGSQLDLNPVSQGLPYNTPMGGGTSIEP